MNIYFAGSKGKTGRVIFNYLKGNGFKKIKQVNVDSTPLEKLIQKESIIIDFTTSDVAIKHAKTCLNNNSHFICGTTGIDPKIINKLRKEAKGKGLSFIFNPNFSSGISYINNFLKKYSKNYAYCKILESHNMSKKDLPSGTALLLQNSLPKGSMIDSIRTTFPSLEHTITLSNYYEEIQIMHKVNNKIAYAKGVEKTLLKIIKDHYPTLQNNCHR